MNRFTRLLLALLTFLIALPALAQTDALNLPTDLYVLLNEGVVQRYGVGAAGVANITPPEVFVVDFAVSPDGSQIAYRTQDGLILAPLADSLVSAPAPGVNVDPSAGVPPARGRGVTVAWTPQGDAVAYTTLDGARVWYNTGAFGNIAQAGIQHLQWSPNGEFLVAGVPDDIYWVYRRQDPSLTLVAAIPSSVGVAWMSDAVLAFVPQTGGLFVMDLRAANAQAQLLDAGSTYQLPFVAPDSRLLVFRHNPADTNVPEGFGQLVSVVPGTPLEVVGQTPIDLSGGLQWGPDGRLMIAFEGGILALYDPVVGQGFPLPIVNVVAYGWGPYPPPESTTISDTSTAATEEAIFPDVFPTFDPLTPIPGVSTATPPAANNVENPAATAEASG